MSSTDTHQAAPLFTLPFVLSMGPQRSGTTWIYEYLKSRGDICLPDGVKEVFYFDQYYDKGAAFYASHFHPDPDQHKLCVEIAATYFDNELAPERVKDCFGDNIRLICPLRDPLTRSFSLYQHYVRYGIVRGDLAQAIEQKPQIIESSRYAAHLKRWYDVFGADKITLLFQEDLEEKPQEFLHDLCDALGLDYQDIPASELTRRVNPTTQSRNNFLASMAQNGADFLRRHRLYWPINLAKSIGLKRFIFGKENPQRQEKYMAPEDLHILLSHLGDEHEKLEALIGRPIKAWR